MASSMFSRKQVERSLRTFRDRVDDIKNAPIQGWDSCLVRLLHHCKTDPVMAQVVAGLEANPIDADAWFAKTLGSVVGMVGSGTLEWPLDEDDVTSLCYKVLKGIERENDPLNVRGLCFSVLGGQDLSDMFSLLNENFVERFAREVIYRLSDLLEDSAGASEVPIATIQQVFHGPVNQFGPLQGSIVAVGGSTVSNSSAASGSDSALTAAIESLSDLVGEANMLHQSAVAQAIDVLARASKGIEKDAEDVSSAVKTIATSTASGISRLKAIAGRFAAQVTSNVVAAAIRQYFGMDA